MAVAYAGQDVDGDVARAFLARWTQLAPTLGTLVPGGMKQEPLDATPAAQPYGTFDVQPSASRRDEFHSGGQIQYRDVIIKIRGIEKAMVTGTAGLLRKMLSPPNPFPIDGLMRVEPQVNKITTPPDEKYGQQQIHIGTVTLTIWIDHPNEG